MTTVFADAYPALPMAQARECGLVPATHRAETWRGRLEPTSGPPTRRRSAESDQLDELNQSAVATRRVRGDVDPASTRRVPAGWPFAEDDQRSRVNGEQRCGRVDRSRTISSAGCRRAHRHRACSGGYSAIATSRAPCRHSGIPIARLMPQPDVRRSLEFQLALGLTLHLSRRTAQLFSVGRLGGKRPAEPR